MSRRNWVDDTLPGMSTLHFLMVPSAGRIDAIASPGARRCRIPSHRQSQRKRLRGTTQAGAHGPRLAMSRLSLLYRQRLRDDQCGPNLNRRNTGRRRIKSVEHRRSHCPNARHATMALPWPSTSQDPGASSGGGGGSPAACMFVTGAFRPGWRTGGGMRQGRPRRCRAAPGWPARELWSGSGSGSVLG